MPAKSYTHDGQVLNFFLRGNPGGTITAPASVYVALLTVAPSGPGDTGTEVTNANGYARTVATFDAPVNGVTQNSGTVTFPAATGSWGTVVAAAIYDSGTYGGGNLLYYGTLGLSKLIDNGDTASFAAGALTVTEQ